MKNTYCQIGMLGVLLAFALPAFSQSNVACPVETPYTGPDENPVSFQDMFGHDVLEKMQCNKRRSSVKMVMQVNAFEVGPPGNRRPYGFRNLPNIIKDFEKTHGIENWKIAIVIHSGGFPFVEKGNNYEDLVENYANHPNVDIYYCLNTAAARGHKTTDIVDGVKFVPAGLSSIMDLQYQGYKYIQP
jgi:intracellular sulfur oxidation DsrE/DsrF family protein